MNKNTHELVEGDIVVHHGMRLLIDRTIKVSQHPINTNSPTLYTQALVLNRDEVPSSVVPLGWTADWDRNVPRGSTRPHNGEHRWTIQGNKLARWYVEEASA